MLVRRGLVALLGVALPVWVAAAPPVTAPRKPMTHTKVPASKCVKRYDAKDRSLVFLINRCDREMYVSVVEYREHMPEKRCAVFGLQADGYGKAYAHGEWYVPDSLQISENSERALVKCRLTGYEVVGGGQGEFVRITAGSGGPADAMVSRAAPYGSPVAGPAVAESGDAAATSGPRIVEYTCEDCEPELIALMNAVRLTTSQSGVFVTLMQTTVAEIESNARRQRLRSSANTKFVERNDRRRLWAAADEKARNLLTEDQWGAYEQLRTFVDTRIGAVGNGLGAGDRLVDLSELTDQELN